MQIERQVTDITIGVIATYLLYIFVLSPTENIFVDIGIWLGILLLSLIFIHLIFKQLGYFTEKSSLLLAYVCFFITLGYFTMYLLGGLQVFDGYWYSISESSGDIIFTSINYLLFFLLGFAVFLSRDAE